MGSKEKITTDLSKETTRILRDLTSVAEKRRKNEDLRELLQSVKGWLNYEEMMFLNDNAKQISEGVIVEIGTYRGRSAIALAKDAKIPVYCIDPYYEGETGADDRRIFIENIIKLNLHSRISIINLESDQAVLGWKHPIGLLYIDGSHEYEQIKSDAEKWIPHVVCDGIIAFHDNNFETVIKVLEFVENSKDWSVEIIKAGGRITAYRKIR